MRGTDRHKYQHYSFPHFVMAEHVHYHNAPADSASDGMSAIMVILVVVALLAVGGYVVYTLAYGNQAPATDANSINVEGQIDLPGGDTNSPPANQ